VEEAALQYINDFYSAGGGAWAWCTRFWLRLCTGAPWADSAQLAEEDEPTAWPIGTVRFRLYTYFFVPRWTLSARLWYARRPATLRRSRWKRRRELREYQRRRLCLARAGLWAARLFPRDSS